MRQLARRQVCTGLVAWVCGLGSLACPALSWADRCGPTVQLHLQTVLPGVAVAQGHWPGQDAAQLAHAATTVVLGQGREVTVVDPGPTFKAAQSLKASLQCQRAARVTSVINTHAHAEQVLGNSAFQVPVSATAVTTASMKSRCPSCLQAMQSELGTPALRGTRIVWPSKILRPGQAWPAGGRRWQVLEMAMAHTESDLVLWSAEEGIALAGGLVDGGRMPVLAQGRVLGWLQALDRLQALPVQWLVGQHLVSGPGQVQEALHRQRQYLCGLVQFAWQGLERGWSEAEVIQGAVSPVLWTPSIAGQERAWAQQHQFNQLRAWREIEALWINQQAPPRACASMPDIVR